MDNCDWGIPPKHFLQNVLKLFTIPISGRKERVSHEKTNSCTRHGQKKQTCKLKMSHPTHHFSNGPSLTVTSKEPHSCMTVSHITVCVWVLLHVRIPYCGSRESVECYLGSDLVKSLWLLVCTYCTSDFWQRPPSPRWGYAKGLTKHCFHVSAYNCCSVWWPLYSVAPEDLPVQSC